MAGKKDSLTLRTLCERNMGAACWRWRRTASIITLCTMYSVLCGCNTAVPARIAAKSGDVDPVLVPVDPEKATGCGRGVLVPLGEQHSFQCKNAGFLPAIGIYVKSRACLLPLCKIAVRFAVTSAPRLTAQCSDFGCLHDKS